MTFILTAIASVLGKDMTFILQVQQRPEVMISSQNDAAALATVATVRAAVGVIFHVAQMHTAPSALA
jgi:hypothetical protein